MRIGETVGKEPLFVGQLPASKSFGPLGAPSQFLRRLFQGGYILLA
jgi:hypothetical protein